MSIAKSARRLRLRWGITAGGVLVMACRSKRRADNIVARAQDDTPAGSKAWPVVLIDLYATRSKVGDS